MVSTPGPAVRLTSIAACCGLIITLAWWWLQPRVAENQLAFANRQLQEVAGRADVDIRPLEPRSYVLMSRDGVAGHIFEVTTDAGYNGRITMWLAVGIDGRVLGVRVTEHRETPGIGDGIELDVSDWILGFNGRSLNSPVTWKPGSDFDKMTGATITSRAVITAVHDGLVRHASGHRPEPAQ